jgi:putative endonuclease
MQDKDYYVYILASSRHTLYVGVTNNLVRRMNEHKQADGFTKRYGIDQLVYYEHGHDIIAAIEREKELKSKTRAKKIALIETENPNWVDLSADWFAGS